MRWYREGQTYRFKQPVGKQYAYGKSPDHLSEIQQRACTNSASGGENSSTEKVHGSRKELEPKAVVKTIEALRPHSGVRELCSLLVFPNLTTIAL
jgi:radical SAM superfamily enzyme with C-terminal helix-hairpin-helix motif